MLRIKGFASQPATLLATKPTKEKDVLSKIWLACFAVVLLVALYGVVRYPSAPVRFRDGGYFDKANNRYSESEYQSFILWERCFLGAGVLVVLITVPLALWEHKKRRR